MKAIFPAPIDGDLLKLVHLSNGFRLLEGAKLLKAGDVCKAEARIVGVTNSDAGKTVKVKGFVTRGNERVIEVVSSFLYRGRFTDFANTFEIIDEPDYVVDIKNDALDGFLDGQGYGLSVICDANVQPYRLNRRELDELERLWPANSSVQVQKGQMGLTN